MVNSLQLVVESNQNINSINPSINQKGNIFNIDGDIIGTHKGIANYTIGQRKGLGISGSSEPLYVVKINKKNKSIVNKHYPSMMIMSSIISWCRVTTRI